MYAFLIVVFVLYVINVLIYVFAGQRDATSNVAFIASLGLAIWSGILLFTL